MNTNSRGLIHLCFYTGIRVIGILLLPTLLLIYFSMPPISLAQTPTPTPTVSPTLSPIEISPSLTQTVSSTLPLTSISLPPEETNILSLTLAELGHDTVTLSGPSGSRDFEIGLPVHWEILPGSSLTLLLNYTGFPSVMPTPESGPDRALAAQIANLQITLNDVLVHQTTLTTFGQHSLTIPLPDSWPERTNGGHRLKVSIRTEGGSCEESLQNSVTISKESSLTLGYRLGPLFLDLAQYPSPFFQNTFLSNTVRIVLPSLPSNSQVAAGLSLAAGLGRLTDNDLMITTITDLTRDETNPFEDHLILVGTPDSNTLIRQLNETTTLLTPLRPRRLELVTSGLNVVAPNTHLTYTLQITNTEATSTSLHLRSRLPYPFKSASCQPDCHLADAQVSWDIDSLQPNATSIYTLTFVLPTTITLEAIDLTSELIQNQEVVNVSTLRSLVQQDATPVLTHTQQIGDVFFVSNGQAVSESDGIIELMPSPWQHEKALLLVTGLTNEGVFKAGRALGTTTHFPGMRGQVVLVQEVPQQLNIPLESNGDFTLTDLGYQDRVVSGVGQNNVIYRFDLPSNWRLTEEANIHLHFSHSSLLDPIRSSLSLIFNNTPIASIVLDDSNAQAGELNALLPPQAARPGQVNTLIAQVETHLPYPCSDPNSSQAWVTLNANTSLSLFHVLNNITHSPDLGLLPIPFSGNPNLADILLVLPEQPSVVEYNTAMRIIALLGAASNGDDFHPAVAFGDPTDTDLSDYHLIVIGRPSRNLLLQMVNETLPQPFIPETDIIRQQIDEIVFRLPPDLDLGYLQLIPSNWSSDHLLLAVTGTSDVGVDLATQALIERARQRQLTGNLALLREDKIFTSDTQQLTSGGEVAAIATSIPEVTIVGTATPTPRSTPTPAPVPTIEAISNLDNIPSPIEEPTLPPWLLGVIGISVVTIFIILGIAYWQSQR